MFKTILLANDGSEGADKALVLAVGLAKQAGADLHMVCIEELFGISGDDWRGGGREAHGRALLPSRGAPRRATRREARRKTYDASDRRPVRDIILLAGDLKADLLVIGATGHSTFYERVLGTRADRLVDLSPCPVLVAK